LNLIQAHRADNASSFGLTSRSIEICDAKELWKMAIKKIKSPKAKETPEALFYSIQARERFKEEEWDSYEGPRNEVEAVKKEGRGLEQAPERPPATCLGYIEMDRMGDAGSAASCIDCGQRIWATAWVGLLSDGMFRAPLCDLCAKSK
jgi:hypothetical protein